MSTHAARREIEVTHHGDVGVAIPELLRELREGPGRRVQSFTADIDRAVATVEVTPPHEVLQRVGEVLAESDDHPRVPDDTDKFGVASVDLAVDELGTVTIEVYDDD